MKHKIRVDEKCAGQRLDVFLAESMESVSRSAVQQAMAKGLVRVDGVVVKKKGHELAGGEWVEYSQQSLPDASPHRAEEVDLDIRYEDMWLLVVNKPPGMVVHPAPGHHRGTLVNALLGLGARLSDVGSEGGRPGIVHRLDKETSGLLLVAKTDLVHRKLAEMLKKRTITRTYVALVHGSVNRERGRISGPIGRHPRNRIKMTVLEEGKPATTDFSVLHRFPRHTFLRLNLQTGRTHQIRVHFAHLGWPVVGDDIYGRKEEESYTYQGQMLHARTLEFEHPVSGVPLKITAPPPRGFTGYLRLLFDGETRDRL